MKKNNELINIIELRGVNHNICQIILMKGLSVIAGKVFFILLHSQISFLMLICLVAPDIQTGRQAIGGDHPHAFL